MGNGLGPLGFGLVIVFFGFLLVLAVELYYLLLYRKRSAAMAMGNPRRLPVYRFQHYRSSSSSSSNSRSSELHGKSSFIGLCWTRQSPRNAATVKSVATGAARDQAEVAPGVVVEAGAAVEEDDNLDLQLSLALSGPPRTLFTIREETSEGTDSEDGRFQRRGSVSISSDQTSSTSSCTYPDLSLEEEEDDHEEEEEKMVEIGTPFVTPPSSPDNSVNGTDKEPAAVPRSVLPFFKELGGPQSFSSAKSLQAMGEISASSSFSSSSENLSTPSFSCSPCLPSTRFGPLILTELSASSSSLSCSTPLSPPSSSHVLFSVHTSPKQQSSPELGPIDAPRFPPVESCNIAASQYRSLLYQRIHPTLDQQVVPPSLQFSCGSTVLRLDPSTARLVKGAGAGDCSSSLVLPVRKTKAVSGMDSADFSAFPASWPPSPVTPPLQSALSSPMPSSPRTRLFTVAYSRSDNTVTARGGQPEDCERAVP